MGRRSQHGTSGRGRGKKKRGGGCSNKKGPTKEAAAALAIDTSAPLAFAVGTRIVVPGLLDHCPEFKYDTGTIIKHYYRDESWEEGVVAPYAARMDCGRHFCFMRETAFHLLDEEPLEIVFKMGSRVECQFAGSDEWFPGVVTQANEKYIEHDVCPYVIRFDYGRDRMFWGPPNCIRSCDIPPPKNSMKKHLRFGVGDRVECSLCEGCDLPGTIVKTWYCEESEPFTDSHAVPYQIQLDRGDFISAPMDDDTCIRRTKVSAPECWICFDNEQSESNLIVRECACRGEGGGFVHVNCVVQLAISKVDLSKEPDEDNHIAMCGCITCRQIYPSWSHCRRALSKTFYCITDDLGISNTWNKMSLTMMSGSLAEEGKYEEAIKLLQDRISKIRSRVEAEIEEADIEVLTRFLCDDVSDPHRLVNPKWLIDLSNFLLDLSDVYSSMNRFDEMKLAIDESLHYAKFVDGDKPSAREVNAISALARHCYLTGEKGSALEYAEKAIRLIENSGDADQDILLNLLWHAGELNIYFGKKKRAMQQLKQFLDKATILYGNNHVKTQKAREEIQQLSESRRTPYEAIMSAGK